MFGPGRHTLSTQNIPLLANLISIPFGGNSPFRAEVVFVSMADFIDQKWGTPEPVAFRDTELGMVRLRAFGTYSMAVADPQQFVNKIVGTQGLYDTDQIGDYLRSIIVSRFNDTLGETMKHPARPAQRSTGTGRHRARRRCSTTSRTWACN